MRAMHSLLLCLVLALTGAQLARGRPPGRRLLSANVKQSPPVAAARYQFASSWGGPVPAVSGGLTFHGSRFNGSVAVAMSSNGKEMFVLELEACRVQRFSTAGRRLGSWGQPGVARGRFMQPNGIAVGAGGNVYVTDSGNNRVQAFSPSGRFLFEWGSFGLGAPGRFQFPMGIATDATGNVYVVDSGNHRVQVFTSRGRFISGWTSGNDRPWESTSHLMYVAVDSTSGAIFLAQHRVIHRLSPSGQRLQLWGGLSMFSQIKGIAFDSSRGRLLVADADAHTVQAFSPKGARLGQFGREGAGPGRFLDASGLAVAKDGSVLVVDHEQNMVHRFVRKA